MGLELEFVVSFRGCIDSCYVVFLIQMNDAIYFTPNYETDIEFGTALKEAVSHGVHLAAYSSDVTFNSISLKCSVPIIL